MSGHDRVRLGPCERHEREHIQATVKIRPGRWYWLTRQANMRWFFIASAASAAAFFALTAGIMLLAWRTRQEGR